MLPDRLYIYYIIISIIKVKDMTKVLNKTLYNELKNYSLYYLFLKSRKIFF